MPPLLVIYFPSRVAGRDVAVPIVIVVCKPIGQTLLSLPWEPMGRVPGSTASSSGHASSHGVSVSASEPFSAPEVPAPLLLWIETPPLNSCSDRKGSPGDKVGAGN